MDPQLWAACARRIGLAFRALRTSTGGTVMRNILLFYTHLHHAGAHGAGDDVPDRPTAGAGGLAQSQTCRGGPAGLTGPASRIATTTGFTARHLHELKGNAWSRPSPVLQRPSGEERGLVELGSGRRGGTAPRGTRPSGRGEMSAGCGEQGWFRGAMRAKKRGGLSGRSLFHDAQGVSAPSNTLLHKASFPGCRFCTTQMATNSQGLVCGCGSN